MGAGSALANTGTISAETGGSVSLGAMDNEGKLKVAGGTMVLRGAVTGAGKATIDGGKLKATAAFNQKVRFKGPTGNLVLTDSPGLLRQHRRLFHRWGDQPRSQGHRLRQRRRSQLRRHGQRRDAHRQRRNPHRPHRPDRRLPRIDLHRLQRRPRRHDHRRSGQASSALGTIRIRPGHGNRRQPGCRRIGPAARPMALAAVNLLLGPALHQVA